MTIREFINDPIQVDIGLALYAVAMIFGLVIIAIIFRSIYKE